MDEESLKHKPLYTSTPLNKLDMKKRQLDRSGTPQSSISLSSPLHKNMKASKKGKDSSDVDDIFALYSDNDDTNKTSNGDSEYNPSNSMPDVEESASSIIEKSTHSTDKDGNEINEEDIEEEIDDGVDIVQDSISEVITEEKNAMTNALNDSQEPAQINEAIQESESESQIVADSFEGSPIQKSNSTSNVMDNNIVESGQSKDILSVEKINSIPNDLEKNFDGIELSNNDKSMNKVEHEDLQNEDPKLFNNEEAIEEINVEKDSTYELSSNSEAIEELDFEQDIISVPAVLKNNARGPPVITPPQFNPEKPVVAHLPMQAPVQHGRLFGGAMTDERMLKIQGISNDVVTAMHSSLSSIPENAVTEAPRGLRIDLLPHQKTGLTWLLWREQQMPPSGILADDMGLGKTLSLISLILHKKNARKTDPTVVERENHLRRNCVFERHLIPANSTLVIAPASLIYQWEKEIMDRVQEGLLRVFIFHGPKNKREISAHRLSKYDIVITTYELLVSELKSRTKLIGQSDSEEDSDNPSHGRGVRSKPKTKSLKPKASHDSVLMDIAWERIILDEAHEIRNKNAQKSRSCSRLEAVHRWCLTGTPIHNKLWDLYSLIRFLRVTPFSEEKIWKEFIDNSSMKSTERLNTIVKSILLRRAKNQICTITNKPMIEITSKKWEVVNLELGEWESHCYSIMFEASKQKVSDILQDAGMIARRRGRKPLKEKPEVAAAEKIGEAEYFKVYSCILVLLLRLRQACVHMSLTKDAIDMDAFKVDDYETDKVIAAEFEASFANMSLDESGLVDTSENKGQNKQIEKVFQREYASTKVVAVLERLKPIIENGDKCVIVSQWTSMLSIIEYHLKLSNTKYTSITGNVKAEERQHRVDSFNKRNFGPSVMLLSLTAGGVGLNLVGGNHLFMVDLHWNPALELQACDRIHRLGQTKNVFIHKFVCSSTIEQRVLQLQEKKTQLATSVLEGAASKKLTKLTKDELMFLFELDKPAPTTQKTRAATALANANSQPTTSSQPTA
uniref:Uncharacterized protein n=1 Tax=Meloidogyne enterolobii TaxID=390850 RepID=A0A6V7U4G7_MELEN|nr:unnamed protein product [Meloidogyne enterolobii]